MHVGVTTLKPPTVMVAQGYCSIANWQVFGRQASAYRSNSIVIPWMTVSEAPSVTNDIEAIIRKKARMICVSKSLEKKIIRAP